MTSEPLTLLLTINSPATDDPEWLDERSRQLLTELRDLDVAFVKPASIEDVPSGAKAVASIQPGALLLAVLPAMLQNLVDFLQSWVMRADDNIVKIAVGDVKLELTSDRPLSPEEIGRLIERCRQPTLLDNQEGDQVDNQHLTDHSLLPRFILFLAADPTDREHLRSTKELSEIQAELQRSEQRTQFALKPHLNLQRADISQALLDNQPAIVHFAGHGTGSGELCFEDPTGKAVPIEINTLAELFRLVQHSLECVILNACYSEPQAQAIAPYVRYVIGTPTDITDPAAIAFAVGFYRALGAGKAIQEAFQFGCIQIKLLDISADQMPILIGG